MNACLLQLLLVMMETGLSSCVVQVCGRPPLGNRIVGGVAASPGAWPWQVDIQMGASGHICGGSVIAKNWILSAAHCFPKPQEVSAYRLFMGRHLLHGTNQFEMVSQVERVVIADGYSDPEKGGDLALVQLRSPVSWSDRIQPVCLPFGGFQFIISLTGSGILQEVQVPIIDQSSCQLVYQVLSPDFATIDIRSDMICAGLMEGGKDSCQGDSGGPLVCPFDNGTWIQAGIVSFGLGCAQKNRPGIYSRVSSFASLIRNTVPEAQFLGHGSRSESKAALVLGLAFAFVLLWRENIC
ncbi:hypothetical protein DNTS_035195 [Danionella cerebrum]|uniref:Peptidase S1 domain-containing protein n=1 Tax=Danionella cerebrum TaxID=2873325 RepID=A0A553N3C8_9TELE|nr:hypothetical protein DNTS_017603 [Danionella translucida]TRY98226.1 hypothetical protein DNTS_035195 [Danionella translucida]